MSVQIGFIVKSSQTVPTTILLVMPAQMCLQLSNQKQQQHVPYLPQITADINTQLNNTASRE